MGDATTHRRAGSGRGAGTPSKAARGPAAATGVFRRRWPDRVVPLAGGWSLLYCALGLYWAVGGAGFPFGAEHDPDARLSALVGLRAASGALLIAALGLTGALVAAAMGQTRPRDRARSALLAPAWAACAALLLVIPAYRVFVAVAYAPILLPCLRGARSASPTGPAARCRSGRRRQEGGRACR